MMKRIALLVLMAASAFAVQAQMTIAITDVGPVTLTCGSGLAFDHTFTDDDDAAAYPPNANFSITVCPDGLAGSKVTLGMFPEVGGVWDVHGSDTLFVYDGTDANAPLIGAFNSDTDTNGINVQASFNNPSGCLTLVFVSDGADEGDGFGGTINCGYPCQPIGATIASDPLMVPADTGYIDICLGDTVWLNGSGTFPYSGTNGGIGYDQTNATSTFDWTFADGTTFTDEQSVYFVPQVRAGYFVEMKVTDVFGCVEFATTKIRVATVPNFSQTAALAQDTICFGSSTILIGGVTFNDTAGVDASQGAFINGGIFAGLTYLPDGSGSNYETTIEITQFDSGQVVQNASDVIDVCLTMEHSYLGDLEMMLTCPNGTSINIFNSYNGGNTGQLFPGGFGGGMIYLGQALDNTSGQPGVGWEYCFSDLATWGPIATEYQTNTTLAGGPTPGTALISGTYKPEQSFDNLLGCPINGTWTITVRDNWAQDDGYIFEWGILFNPDIDPNAEFYVPAVVDGWWTPDPSIVTVFGDTAIEVLPPAPGNYDYTFNVTDDFGCHHDTTLTVYMVPPLSTFIDDTAVCSNQFALSAAEYDIQGAWSYSGPVGGVASFSPNQNSYHPTVQVSEYGEYEFIYESMYCGQSDTVVIDFNPTPSPVPLSNQTVCPGTDLVFDAGNEDIGATYLWMPGGATGQVFEMDSILNSGGIQVTVTNDCGTANGAATITVHTLTVTGPLEVCLADEADLFATYSTTGGNWSYSGPANATATFLPNEQDATPSVTVDMPGHYQFVFTDDVCAMQKTWDVTFTPAPTIEISMDTNRICVEGEITLSYQTNTTIYDELHWNQYSTNSDTLVLLGTDSIPYSAIDTLFHISATVSNLCGTGTDEVTYKVIDCTLEVPNVFNPDSDSPDNAYFNLVSLGLHPGNNVKIFDRWGRKCYDVNDYHLNPWDGGKESDGVYFWSLERPGYDAESGYVHLVRGSAN